MRCFDRLIAFLDDAESASAPVRIRAFENILVVVTVTDLWEHALKVQQQGGAFFWPLPVFGTLCGAVACIAAWRRVGFLLLALGVGVLIWSAFPATGNHVYLECFLCSICALLDASQNEEQRLLTQAVRWVTCVILFFAGIQKLVHGYYTSGLMPAYLLKEPRFEWIFAPLVPAGEVQRIQSFRAIDGAGPYLVSAPGLLLASNLAWILEIALAVALFVPATRRAAVFAAIALVVLIETGAREITFGLLFVNVLLMFLRSDANRRFVAIAAVTCVLLILMRLRWLPLMEIY